MDRKLGGIMSGVRAWGGSEPFRHLATNHMAKANCSLFNLPVCLMSHNALRHPNYLAVDSSRWRTYQMWASMGWATPLRKNTSLISAPDTNPSLSTSLLMNSSSDFAFSSAVTIQGAGGGADWTSLMGWVCKCEIYSNVFRPEKIGIFIGWEGTFVCSVIWPF